MKAYPSSRLRLTPYRFRDTDARRGTLRVPVYHADPGGAAFHLPFVWLQSRARTPGTPVVFLTGGPGLSGIRSAQGRLFPLFDALRDRADVVLLDQRACIPGARLRERPPQIPAFPPDRAVTRAEYLRAIADTVRVDAAYLEARGMPIASLNTNESADDVAALVRALYGREGRVALLGWSYGSHLAMAMIKRHESRVERAVLAAPEGPDHTFKRPVRIQEHLARLGERAGTDLCATLASVLDHLEKHPEQIVMTDEQGESAKAMLGRFDLEWVMSESAADPRFLKRLPAWLAQMERGNFNMMGTERLLQGAWQSLRDELPRGAARYAMDCASGATAKRRAMIEREARETLLGNTIDFPLPEICDAVGNPDLGDDFRAALKSNVPALFITGTLDCRTPAENVAELAPGLPDHRHLVVQDAGHGDLLLPSAVQAAIVRFISGADPQHLDVSVDTPFAFE